MTAATRRCPGPHDPPELIPSEKAFCRRHWYALPKPMRDDIWTAYRIDRGGQIHLRLLAEAAMYVRGTPTRNCDCTVCPCNVPLEESGRVCPDCRAGNHFDRTGRRYPHKGPYAP